MVNKDFRFANVDTVSLWFRCLAANEICCLQEAYRVDWMDLGETLQKDR